MKYYPVELHAHTEHSDGRFSVDELIHHATDYGYAGLILTDHNTFSGYEELKEKKLDNQIPVMQGIEWTTFFGHMLVHGATEMVDWRKATMETIDEHIQKVKEVDGLVGIAHPFAIGSPMCTGCHWDFQIQNWDNVDYIEIWNRTNPDDQFWSRSAYAWWSGLLKEGIHISCSAGRDWHRPEKEMEHVAVTYVGMPQEFNLMKMKESLRSGNMYITLGPRIEWQVSVKQQVFHMGDTIPTGEGVVQVAFLETEIPALQSFDFVPKKVRLINKENIVFESTIQQTTMEIPVFLDSGYIRLEVLGFSKGKENERLVISNPLYIQD